MRALVCVEEGEGRYFEGLTEVAWKRRSVEDEELKSIIVDVE